MNISFRRSRGLSLECREKKGGDLRHITCVVAVALALAGCLPVTSTSPVGTTKSLGADNRLVGMWQGATDDGAPAWFAFVPGAHGGITAIVIGFPSATDSSGFYGTYSVRTASLGKAAYVNAREVMENGQPVTGPLAEKFMLLLYRFRGPHTLVLYLADEDATKDAVKARKVDGTIEPGKFGDVTLTARPADLDRFFASDAALKLFTKPFVLLSRKS